MNQGPLSTLLTIGIEGLLAALLLLLLLSDLHLCGSHFRSQTFLPRRTSVSLAQDRFSSIGICFRSTWLRAGSLSEVF